VPLEPLVLRVILGKLVLPVLKGKREQLEKLVSLVLKVLLVLLVHLVLGKLELQVLRGKLVKLELLVLPE
jgi:hypothetical protein